MKKTAARMTQGAMLGALYAALSFLQNALIPGSGSFAIQLRVAESLCVFAFFTPAAIPGLSLGCAVFNLAAAGSLPLDALVGSAATALAALLMWKLRRRQSVGLWMPVLTNALLVGWELTIFVGGGFLVNACYVALGEAAVMLTSGNLLAATLKKYRSQLKL